MLGGAAVAVAAPTGTAVGDDPAVPGNPGLAQVGAIGTNGFPAWYRDKNGTRLEACLDNQDPMCAAVFGAVPNPNAASTPGDVTGNFPDEFFYQAASAGIDNVGATDAQGRLGKASLDAALEGAFAAGAPKPGDQMVFARLRLRITSGLLGGKNYLFVHPYGERTIQTDADQDNLFVTEDIGTAAGVFTDALKGRIAPFLKWDPSVDPQAPDGYTGDPAVDHPITGGVNDYFAIIGPGVGANRLADGTQNCPASVLAKGASAPGGTVEGTSGADGKQIGPADCLYTNLFSLLGKLAQNAGVDAKGTTFSRDAAGNTAVDVQAESDGGQTIVVRPTSNRTVASRLFSPTKLAEDHGRYFAHVTMPAIKNFPNGTENQVQVINGTDGSPQDSKDVTPVDEILNATATWYNTLDAGGNGTLTVAAQSSDQFATDNVTLSVDDPNGGQRKAFGANGQAALTLPAAPRTVTITSSKGGTLTIPVHSDMTKPATPAPLTANAGRPVKAATGASVKLFGTGSTGPIASYAWTGPFAVTNGTVDTATPNTANGGAITAGADTEAATLTAPSAAGQYGYQLEVTGDNAAKATGTTIVTVNAGGSAPVPGAGDLLTPGKVRYTQSQGRMVIDGTATVTSPHKILIWFANHVPADPTNATPDATATVATDGTWAFDTGRDGMPNPPNADCVSYISAFGNPAVVGNNATLAPADEWNCLPIDGRNLTAPLPPAPNPIGGAAAAAGLRAVPGLGAAAPAALRAAVFGAPATVTAASVGTPGVPVTVSVPAGATLVRLRLLTTANKALLTTFKKAKGGTQLKVKLRSTTLRKQLRAGKRFIVEVRAGTAKNRLGKPTRKVIRVR